MARRPTLPLPRIPDRPESPTNGTLRPHRPWPGSLSPREREQQQPGGPYRPRCLRASEGSRRANTTNRYLTKATGRAHEVAAKQGSDVSLSLPSRGCTAGLPHRVRSGLLSDPLLNRVAAAVAQGYRDLPLEDAAGVLLTSYWDGDASQLAPEALVSAGRRLTGWRHSWPWWASTTAFEQVVGVVVCPIRAPLWVGRASPPSFRGA
jgi:hypothetical protein